MYKTTSTTIHSKEVLVDVIKAINSSSRTVVGTNRHSQAVRRLLDSSNKIVATSRDTAKEQSLFASSSKNKVLTKEAGIAYL